MKTLITLILVVILGAAGWYLYKQGISSESPNQNQTSPLNLKLDGVEASSAEIVVESPKQSDAVSSPLNLSGRARGPWYFEASAPVFVYDANGKLLGQSYVTAQGEWMTTEFVPFAGTVTFSKGDTQNGAVVFMNDNPSGDPERSKYVVIPVNFR